EFWLEKINDALWSARYQALVGDYEAALTHVALGEAALRHLRAKKGTPPLSNRELSDVNAEVFHVRAYRIFVEQRRWRDAIAQFKAGLRIAHLSDEWKSRFQWHLGLASFQMGQWNDAIQAWKTLLATENKERKDQALYWMA